MAKGQMRVPKEKKKPKADKDKPKQLSAYKLSQMSGSTSAPAPTAIRAARNNARRDGVEPFPRLRPTYGGSQGDCAVLKRFVVAFLAFVGLIVPATLRWRC